MNLTIKLNIKTTLPKTPVFLASSIAGIMTLTACQTSPNSLTTTSYTPEQSQSMLTSAIKHTLFSGQDFIAEQQFRLVNPAPITNTAPKQPDPVQQKLDCQNTHDARLTAQMKADNLTKYEKVAELQPQTRQQPYTVIRDDYQACIATAEKLERQLEQQRELAKKSKEEKDNAPKSKAKNKKTPELVATKDEDGKQTDVKDTDLKQSNTTNDPLETSYLNEFAEMGGLHGSDIQKLSANQIANFNNLVAKSGKITYTGNYRPFAGKLTLQADAGFENKNLKYHYRLPVILDIKAQALYVKPDIIMPMTALYLDNQLGMTWQDKWYKFTPPADKKMPTKLLAQSWLLAIKDTFTALPASQFSQVTTDTVAKQLTQTLYNPSQKLTSDATIVHWHQTASEQVAFEQAIIQRVIQRVDNGLKNDATFLAATPAEQENQLKKWQEYKEKLNKSANALSQSLLDENKIQEANQSPSAMNLSKGIPKITGQDIYFILDNSQIKQIYAQQNITAMQQPATAAMLLTFNPDTSTIPEALQPNTLAKLASTLRDTNTANSTVIDGVTEIKRIVNLDDSRRIFGQESDIIKSYKEYKDRAAEREKEKATDKEKTKNPTSEKWEFKPVNENTLPKNQRF